MLRPVALPRWLAISWSLGIEHVEEGVWTPNCIIIGYLTSAASRTLVLRCLNLTRVVIFFSLTTPPRVCVKRVPFVKLAFFTAERSIFLAQKGPFSMISYYKNSDAVKYSTWATFIENVVRNRWKWPVLDQKMHRFPIKTPIWQMVPISRAHTPLSRQRPPPSPVPPQRAWFWSLSVRFNPFWVRSGPSRGVGSCWGGVV